MNDSIDYKGHVLLVSTRETKPGRFVWQYQIDSGPIRESRDHALPSDELAFKDGLDHAKWEADRL